MTTLTKTFLAAAVIGFITGGIVDFSNVTTDPKWTLAMPLGAVFFGLFFISLMLQKEMAEFDREEAKKLELAAVVIETPSSRQPRAGNRRPGQLKESSL